MSCWKTKNPRSTITSNKRKPSICLLILGALMLAGLMSCEMAPCQDIQQNFERTVRAEPGFQGLTDQGAPHLAMAIRLDLLNDLTGAILNSSVGQALAHRGSVSISGQNVAYGITSTGANLRLDASGQCPTCLRIRGDLDARVEATLPIVGTQASPLSGSIDWTIPLAVARESDGKVAVFIDTAQALRMGVPRIQNGALQALPQQWRGLVESALLPELASRIANELPPLRLFGFETPNLGLGGLEISPALFAFDGPSNALVLGIRTNLPVAETGVSQGDLLSALTLGEGQNVALGVQPAALVSAVRIGMQQNRIARRYNINGQANRNGTAHAVVDRFRVVPQGGQNSALGLDLDFRLFNFGSGFGCFSMNGNALSRLQVQNGRVELAVEGVNFSGSALADAANWGSAHFIEQTQLMVSRTLNEDMVFSPEVGMSLRGDQVSTAAGMIVLRGAGRAQ